MAAPSVVDTASASNLIEQAAMVMRELYQAEQADTALTPKRVTLSINPGTGVVTYGWTLPSTIGDGTDGGLSVTPTDYFPA